MKDRDNNTTDTCNYKKSNFVASKQSAIDRGLTLVCLHKYSTKDFEMWIQVENSLAVPGLNFCPETVYLRQVFRSFSQYL
jgi:hypothetical protein